MLYIRRVEPFIFSLDHHHHHQQQQHREHQHLYTYTTYSSLLYQQSVYATRFTIGTIAVESENLVWRIFHEKHKQELLQQTYKFSASVYVSIFDFI